MSSRLAPKLVKGLDRGGPLMAPAAQAQPWRLVALALAMLLPSLGTSIANVALPTLAGAFAASMPQVQWVVVAYLLAKPVRERVSREHANND